MSRIAYVNGRYLPQRQASVNVEDRGYQLATASTRCSTSVITGSWTLPCIWTAWSIRWPSSA